MIDLRFYVLPLVFSKTSDVYLGIEVTDVADNGLVLHRQHVFVVDYVCVASRGDKYIGHGGGFVHGHDAIALHRCL